VVVWGGFVWWPRSGAPRADFDPLNAQSGPPSPTPIVAPVNFADQHYDEAIADLERTLEAGRTKLDPETVRVLEENIGAIDLAIDQCRRALATDPANVYLNTHLANARQRKIALLWRATMLALGS